ncbi:MAG: TlpA disulfide reductase family protein [Odoribacter sp.]
MKLLIFYMLFAVGLASCRTPQKQMILKGQLKGYTESRLFVRELIPGNQSWVNDTLEVKNGAFIYKKEIESPMLISLITSDLMQKIELFVENGEITLIGDLSDPDNIQVSGSASHNEFVRLQQEGGAYLQRLEQLKYERSNAFREDTAKYNALQLAYEQEFTAWIAFLKSRPNYAHSFVIPYYIQEYSDDLNLTQWDDLIAPLDESVKRGVYARHFIAEVELEKKVLPGMPAYNFCLYDTTGREYHLSDYRGKYVLLEFSASWCGWCKLEIPYLKRLHEKTLDKYLVMFTVNLDKEREKWIEEIHNSALPWTTISDLKAFDGTLTKAYHIKGIPEIYLIDPSGKIVTKKLRGESMITYITQLLP